MRAGFIMGMLMEERTGQPGFPVEIVDEDAGEVLIFDNQALLDAFSDMIEPDDAWLDRNGVRRRALELRDQLMGIAGELELLLKHI